MITKWTILFLIFYSTRVGRSAGVELSEIKIESTRWDAFGEYGNLNLAKTEEIITITADFTPKSSGKRRRLSTTKTCNSEGKAVITSRKASISSKKFGNGNSMEAIGNACMDQRCSICDVYFRYDKDYENHFKGSHGIDKPYACALCKRGYAKKSYLFKHLRSTMAHSKTYRPSKTYLKAVFCEICEKNIDGGWMSFDKHARTLHKGIRMFPCSQCPKKYVSRRGLTAHELSTHRKRKWEQALQCEFCKNSFDRTNELKDHREYCEQRQMKKRRGNVVLDCVKRDTKVRIGCDECHDVFKSFKLLKYHYGTMHAKKIKLHHCDYCEESFSARVGLERHLDVRHPREDGDVKAASFRSRKGYIYKCQHCEKEFNTLKKYAEHGKEHPGTAMFYCKLCGKGYSYRRSLWNHANNYHGYNCSRTKRGDKEDNGNRTGKSATLSAGETADAIFSQYALKNEIDGIVYEDDFIIDESWQDNEITNLKQEADVKKEIKGERMDIFDNFSGDL